MGVRGARSHHHGAVNVLVVDDDPVNLMVVSALLETRGFVPMLAADGAEAAALASELHFDLILMDMQMPILDGLSAASLIRQHERSASRPGVPIVAYSSVPPQASVLARHGVNGSLIKPCGDQGLEDCLLRWCPAYGAVPNDGRAANDAVRLQAPSRIARPSRVPRR